MIVVLDTDVIVAAIRSPTGASAALLRALKQRQFVAACSVALFVEYEATCSRAEHVLASGLTVPAVADFLDALAALVVPVEVHYMWRPQLRDACDEMVLEAAVNGNAQAIVTFNVGDFGAAPGRFGLEVLLPRDALQRIRSSSSDGGNSHG